MFSSDGSIMHHFKRIIGNPGHSTGGLSIKALFYLTENTVLKEKRDDRYQSLLSLLLNSKAMGKCGFPMILHIWKWKKTSLKENMHEINNLIIFEKDQETLVKHLKTFCFVLFFFLFFLL